MMAMGENYAILCADSIDDLKEREKVIRELESDGKEIVYISEYQVEHFLGNAIELINNENGILIACKIDDFMTAFLSQNASKDE